jgi:hypothetical protein
VSWSGDRRGTRQAGDASGGSVAQAKGERGAAVRRLSRDGANGAGVERARRGERRKGKLTSGSRVSAARAEGEGARREAGWARPRCLWAVLCGEKENREVGWAVR